MRALGAIEGWPGRHAAVVLQASAGGATVVAATGPLDVAFAHASVTKLWTALAILVEVERGTCDLGDPAGPAGATLLHLLSHASGLPLDSSTPIAAPGTRRVYSNSGFDLAAAHAARRTGHPEAELLRRNVLEPLGCRATRLEGAPSSGVVGPLDELGVLAGELLAPTLLSASLASRLAEVHFPGLAGVLPGFGRQVPCDWGIGAEVKGTKSPHWTGATWPATSLGHFGQAGGFVVVDRAAGVAVATLGDTAFGPWAKTGWPSLTEDVRAELAVGG